MADGYGTDTYCYDTIRTGRLASGPELVAQAIFRRLTTARGTLQDGDEGAVYGLDLLDFVGQVGTTDAVDALPDAVAAEILKDDRVESVVVTATSSTDSAGLVTIVLNADATLQDAKQSFTLTVSITDLDITLLGIETT